MTKTDEIALLDEMIGRFGPHSYLGPWLAEHRADLVADIRSDLPVALLRPSVVTQQAAERLEAARTEAAQITADAQAKAHAMVDDARSRAASIRDRARQALERLAQEARG